MAAVALATFSCSPELSCATSAASRSLDSLVPVLSQLSPPSPLLAALQDHTPVVITSWGFFPPRSLNLHFSHPEQPSPAQAQSTPLFTPAPADTPPCTCPEQRASAALPLAPALHPELLGSRTLSPAADLPSELIMPPFSPHPASKMPLSSSSALDYALSRLLLPDTRNLSPPSYNRIAS